MANNDLFKPSEQTTAPQSYAPLGWEKRAKLIAVELAKLIEWARAFGIPAPDVETVAKAYIHALSDRSEAEITAGFEKIKAVHKYGNRLPLPAEIVALAHASSESRTSFDVMRYYDKPVAFTVPREERMKAEQWAHLKSLTAEKFPSKSDAQVED